MRMNDGTRLENCIGLQARNQVTGEIFDANTYECKDNPVNPGDDVYVDERLYRYVGEDSLGRSIFQALAPFPSCELIEREYKDGFAVVLEIYRTSDGSRYERGKFYIWPYVQRTGANNLSRERYPFFGLFDDRDAAIEAAWEAGKKRIDDLYIGMI
jgi:hypothetical protein